jgi:RimJ/RimL family protein N-acetyltransferase
MLPFVVRELASDEIVGSSRYHDIVPAVARVEIGYTWYARRVQRSPVNTECKLLLLTHAFETLGAQAVGLRTDHMNFESQRAIERLGARRDGSVRDTVMYSILASEWPDVKAHLAWQLERPR